MEIQNETAITRHIRFIHSYYLMYQNLKYDKKNVYKIIMIVNIIVTMLRTMRTC